MFLHQRAGQGETWWTKNTLAASCGLAGGTQMPRWPDDFSMCTQLLTLFHAIITKGLQQDTERQVRDGRTARWVFTVRKSAATLFLKGEWVHCVWWEIRNVGMWLSCYNGTLKQLSFRRLQLLWDSGLWSLAGGIQKLCARSTCLAVKAFSWIPWRLATGFQPNGGFQGPTDVRMEVVLLNPQSHSK